MKLAYLVDPHIGGTYSVFTLLRQGLASRAVDVQCVGSHQLRTDGAPMSESDQAAALIGALETGGFDGVFINVLSDRVHMNIARYLPENMLRIMIVHNITPGTYAAARAIRGHVHATVGVSQRCRHDLIAHHGFDGQQTYAIPNAVDLDAINAARRTPRPEGGLRLLYLGRIEDASKGIFWLPDILRRVPKSVSLTIAGDGPDLAKLKDRFQGQNSRIRFLGAVASEQVPTVLAAHDVLIVPSRYEGFGLVIAEAMAAGCVPVVSDIAGVTDEIVEHGVSGFLFPVGSGQGAAEKISMLEGDPALLAAFSRNACSHARKAFSRNAMARAYRQVLERVSTQKPGIAAPMPLAHWSIPRGMRSGIRTYLPVPVKNWLRVARERLKPAL